MNRSSGTWQRLFIAMWMVVLSTMAAADDSHTKYREGDILVKFADGVTDREKDMLREMLGAVRVKVIRSIGVEQWRLPDGLTTDDALKTLRASAWVAHAEPNYLYTPQTAPNDPLYHRLWFLENTGQEVNGVSGAADADISAPQAWDTETGDAGLIIAVIDSGVAFEHPDLRDNIWSNSGETPDNGIDDDGNGYIDDVYGYDFVNDDPNPSDYSRDLDGDGHGTHVAGIIAARGNNGIGVTGVMWRARIMALQVFDLFETSSFMDAIIQSINIITAVEYAVDNGARIINCSFGGPSFSQFQYDAFRYAHEKGVLVVAAAGNDAANADTIPTYPACYDLANIISVAATDSQDRLAAYSNYGARSVDVAAPGGGLTPGISSTIPPKRETLFSEDFEDGDGRWIKEGVNETWSVVRDSRFGSMVIRDSLGSYGANENSFIQTRDSIDADGYRGLHIQFRSWFQLEPNFDFLIVEGSTDGVNFSTDFPITGSVTGFSQGIERLLSWGSDTEMGRFYLRFRLETDADVNFDGIFIDDIQITGIRWEFSGDEYGYKSGTSMAAPVVSGVAGLVWSRFPGYTHLEVKSAIINGVDSISALSGKTVSGGRVNAAKALSSEPASGSSSPDEEEDGGGGGGCFIRTASGGDRR